jgi:hypothetical protein
MFSKENVKEEHIEEAYKLLKQYCDENKLDMLKFVDDKENINKASEHIHKQLNFAMRLILKPAKIANLINDNHEWIVTKVKEYSDKPKV